MSYNHRSASGDPRGSHETEHSVTVIMVTLIWPLHWSETQKLFFFS